ncbi:hypothetical protein NV379_02785 [Paenibacillus sp. N1-5-1-14]|uniref:hypothetical protein n=1 Tax=Paenibacillus radicibacter TaxID=2972488 RepID=UPI0021595B18|nr:hypothetical protein [Paenibacillus radicibacter]MCR8641573.1 hypothetical protein [Paenibacillus radicibacter]
MEIIEQYWGLIIAVVGAIVYAATHRQASYSYVKKKLYELMLSAEKYAEELVLKTGKDKMDWVITNGYDNLPSYVRLVISKDLFQKLAQELFDKAILIAEKHKIEAN